MSQYLNTLAVTAFDQELKESFQGVGRLRDTVTVRTGVKGDEYRFQQIGKGMAHKRTAPSSDSIPMNINYSKVLVSLEDWDADEYTDIFKEVEVNFDEVTELANIILNALGRRFDQTVIDAVNTARASLVAIGNYIAHGSTGLSIAKLTSLVQLMDDLEIPEDGRYFVGSTTGKRQLLNSTEVTSSDYNSVKALVNGQVNAFLGFIFKWIGTREEGGLYKTGNVRDCFAYHKSSIGSAIGKDINKRVDWVPHKKSHLSAGEMKVGSIVRDLEGVFIVEIDETWLPS